MGGPQVWSGRIRIISPLPGFDPRTVQHVPSHCTDWAIPAHIIIIIIIIIIILYKPVTLSFLFDGKYEIETELFHVGLYMNVRMQRIA
jgi:hypothetical protein